VSGPSKSSARSLPTLSPPSEYVEKLSSSLPLMPPGTWGRGSVSALPPLLDSACLLPPLASRPPRDSCTPPCTLLSLTLAERLRGLIVTAPLPLPLPRCHAAAAALTELPLLATPPEPPAPPPLAAVPRAAVKADSDDDVGMSTEDAAFSGRDGVDMEPTSVLPSAEAAMPPVPPAGCDRMRDGGLLMPARTKPKERVRRCASATGGWCAMRDDVGRGIVRLMLAVSTCVG
jgi:hypothetical protein